MGLAARAEVLIVGGGPCGLMLAIELGRRGVRTLLVDEKPGTALNPQANATQARTIEHYRRLGFAGEVRAQGLPPDYPTDVAYFTRFAGHELARVGLPSAREAVEAVRQVAPFSAAEAPHRVSQKYVEAVLRRHAEAEPSVAVRYGWRLLGFEERSEGVDAQVECVDGGERESLRVAYLAGCDGPRSRVRRALGLGYAGAGGVKRDFMGGRMLAVYLRAPGFYDAVPHARAWMYVGVNGDRRCFMAAVNGRDEFAFHTQLREDEGEPSEAQAKAAFERACGVSMPCEVLSHLTWTAGHALVAERMQRGRVFLGGDAAHLFTPTGGLGYNTAVEDAVNLGWKLAMTLRGQGGPELLASYEAERRPVAERNTAYARGFADSLGLFEAEAALEQPGEAGDEARRRAGAYLERHGRAEFAIPGITFGGRYDGSPIIVGDGTAPPPDRADRYEATACPGGRAPHLWLGDGRSLFDLFGEWTLLRLGPHAPGSGRFEAAASSAGLDLTIFDLPGEEARDLYAADLALIRPDGIVAWRGGEAGAGPAAVLALATGHDSALEARLAS